MLMMGAVTTSCSDYEPKGMPEVPELPTASDLKASIAGRTVTLTWNLPASADITGVRVSCDNAAPTILPAGTTSCVLKGQAMDKELIYTAEFIQPSQIASLDPDIYSVIWIEIDRVGLPMGWENLPEVSDPDVIAALKEYSANGGSLYLANMATQLTVPLGIVPDNMAPTVYGNGEGGSGDDVWVINPYLGWDYRDGADQGFYDRTSHEIFKGITLEDPNGYGYDNLPLIGPGQREDHNCLWDCNIYGKGSYSDVIKNFEVTTNSLVLATWGHVRDHCVAGLVEFYSNSEHGRCIANGFAAYEWNQNSGENPYQHNVEQLTLNILDYLK